MCGRCLYAVYSGSLHRSTYLSFSGLTGRHSSPTPSRFVELSPRTLEFDRKRPRSPSPCPSRRSASVADDSSDITEISGSVKSTDSIIVAEPSLEDIRRSAVAVPVHPRRVLTPTRTANQVCTLFKFSILKGAYFIIIYIFTTFENHETSHRKNPTKIPQSDIALF